ncbi:hypothetical protein MACH15_14720 [Maricaulis maris]|nr:hypothetical protein MACH15_14720 [Maricaulis maris]
MADRTVPDTPANDILRCRNTGVIGHAIDLVKLDRFGVCRSGRDGQAGGQQDAACQTLSDRASFHHRLPLGDSVIPFEREASAAHALVHWPDSPVMQRNGTGGLLA